ncbi:BrnT family toxin [Thiorhodovibrio litoralis]|uniref:BrnT family toxin n=1 Tax=Thiorhodovibrio litoralis TaxID=2952932 RepID=UPI002B261469|nr:BrnT family toxin [Thiorhodovibrio litoralis]WPL14178.1 hypothetical protein Thiosp_04011 [Thiorhodovibrio litoralis]
MRVVYDPRKRAINLKEHGVDLAEVEAVLYDPSARTIEDRDHDEERFLTIGQDHRGRILVIAYHYRGKNELRVISARTASRRERQRYEQES